MLIALGSFVTLSSIASADNSVACWSRESGKRPLVIHMGTTEATFSFGRQSCVLTSVPYNPVSERYKGWIRYANQNPYNKVTRKTACTDVMSAFLNQNDPTSTEFPDVHWISVSSEVQQTGDGMLQLGFQNLWDPGAGGTVKTMIGCKPDKK